MSTYNDDKIVSRNFSKTSYDFQGGAIILIDKPLDWTSFDVVNKIRYKIKYGFGYKKLKVGHAGTLDPLATGLLIVCTGKYTKIIDQIQGQNKVYSGKIILGATTPTYDCESEIDHTYAVDHIDQNLIEKARLTFIGDQMQVPPIYSAIKIKGEAAYKLARRGEGIKMKARKVKIHDFHITSIDHQELAFTVSCSKGTYIRSLAYDLGRKLKSGAYLAALRRERIGNFDVADALNIEEITEIIENVSKESS